MLATWRQGSSPCLSLLKDILILSGPTYCGHCTSTLVNTSPENFHTIPVHYTCTLDTSTLHLRTCTPHLHTSTPHLHTSTPYLHPGPQLPSLLADILASASSDEEPSKERPKEPPSKRFASGVLRPDTRCFLCSSMGSPLAGTCDNAGCSPVVRPSAST